jgi:hypothetical protein
LYNESAVVRDIRKSGKKEVKECDMSNSPVNICYRKIHQDLIECLIDNMLTHYEEISNTPAISQTQALQLVLDVKYLTRLLVPRDNKVMGNS